MTVFRGMITMVVQIRITYGYSTNPNVTDSSTQEGSQQTKFRNANTIDVLALCVLLVVEVCPRAAFIHSTSCKIHRYRIGIAVHEIA